jgi:prevent-host-death family protein
MKVIPISRARDNIYQIVEEAVKFSEPVEISSKKGDVVMVSKADWGSIQETLYLMSFPKLWQDIIDAHNTPLNELLTLEDLGINLDE